MDALISILMTIITAATPLLIAAIGEVVTERAGVLNLGVEGMMACGAVTGFGVALVTGNPYLGVVAAIVAGMALSLIFAVFRCQPAPVCVLDEVDAPLDDANVERLCDLLDAMAAEAGTRFLVVTHHPLTMARMHRLYGVTMQERGVSRLLSVDLGQAVQMAEGPAAA